MRTMVGLWLLMALHPALAASLPDVVEQLKVSVVGIGMAYPPRQPNREGDPFTYLATGFVVGNGRQVITNAHVIPGQIDVEHNQSLVIFAGRGEKAKAYPAEVVRTDEEHDLALLTFQGDPIPPLDLGDSDLVREGQDVAFTGFPMGVVLGLYPVTHRAIVAAITPMARPVENSRTLNAVQLHRIRNLFDAFQLDAIAYPGNSGSPLYEVDSGRVLGVINSVFVKESKESILQKPSGISYAIPANHIKELLTASP